MQYTGRASNNAPQNQRSYHAAAPRRQVNKGPSWTPKKEMVISASRREVQALVLEKLKLLFEGIGKACKLAWSQLRVELARLMKDKFRANVARGVIEFLVAKRFLRKKKNTFWRIAELPDALSA
jgi:hypothetical protein